MIHDLDCTVQDYDHICGTCGKEVPCQQWHAYGRHKNCNVDDPSSPDQIIPLANFEVGE